MQLFIAFLTAFSSDGNFFDTTNATDQRAFTPLLTCIDEIQGVLQGVEYNQPSQIVDCGPTVTYCQKVTAHYMSEKSETQIEMRGCDPIQLGDTIEVVPCTKEGCHEQIIESETYNVCCCSSNMCNSATLQEHIHLLIILASIFLSGLL